MATPELRHMLRDDDLNHEEQKQVLELAIKFHKDRFYHRPFEGPQGIAVIFDKPSTRTRSSFSIGVAELGGYPLVIDKSGSQLGRGEPVADTARVLDRMAYGVVWRTFGQDRVEEMAKYSSHPVVNALTDEFHPCQILADFQTIAEHRGGVENLKNQTIAYLGNAANNMSNSYLLGGAVAGMNVRVAGPYGYLPDPAIVADAEAIAAENGGSVLVTTDPKEAVADADCVFTDTWVSMGEEAEYAVRSKPFWDYQVNAAFVSEAGTLPDTPYVFDKSLLPIMPDEDAIPAEEIAGKAIPLAASYGSRLTEDALKDMQVIVSQYRKPDNDVYLFSTTGSWLVSFWDNDDVVAWMYVDAHTGVPNFLNIVSDCISFQGEPGVEGMHYEE